MKNFRDITLSELNEFFDKNCVNYILKHLDIEKFEKEYYEIYDSLERAKCKLKYVIQAAPFVKEYYENYEEYANYMPEHNV